MHVKNVRQPVQWKRDNLESWRAAHSAERQEEDRKLLADLFNHAAQVPVLKEALDWASDHDIEFIVDHTTTAGGWYGSGTGVVALSKNYFRDPRRMVSFLVHEIRHAWQDYYHMIPTAGKSFASYFMREAMIEADATAHQNLATRQYDHAHQIAHLKLMDKEGRPEKNPGERKEWLEKWERRLDESRRDAGYLWEGFSGWFSSWKPASYGSAALRRFAGALGVSDVVQKDYHFEYNPYEGTTVPVEEGLDVTRNEDVRRLGKSFNGVNYFNADKERSLATKFTSAARAAAFYDETGQRDPLADEVRRRWLGLKHRAGHDVTICPQYNF